MSLIHDPPIGGFIPRLVRVYREMRSPVPVREYPDLSQIVQRRPPRWACLQVAWHQARAAARLK